MLDDFLALFKKAAYFAIFAHAPQVATSVSSIYDAWEWVKQHARVYMEAPSGASSGRRRVIGGMVGALGRALVAMGRAKLAPRRPLFLRSEFIFLRRELPERRITVLG